MGHRKGREEEDGRRMQEKKQRLDTGYYGGGVDLGHTKKVLTGAWGSDTSP